MTRTSAVVLVLAACVILGACPTSATNPVCTDFLEDGELIGCRDVGRVPAKKFVLKYRIRNDRVVLRFVAKSKHLFVRRARARLACRSSQGFSGPATSKVGTRRSLRVVVPLSAIQCHERCCGQRLKLKLSLVLSKRRNSKFETLRGKILLSRITCRRPCGRSFPSTVLPHYAKCPSCVCANNRNTEAPRGDDSNCFAPMKYVALGDSLSSGNGVPDCVEHCDNLFYRFGGDGGGPCARSTRSYPATIAEKIGAELSFLACARATTGSLLANQIPVFSQMSPVDLVTITIAANDIGFLDIATACLSPDLPCDQNMTLASAVAARVRALSGVDPEPGDEMFVDPENVSFSELFETILKGIKPNGRLVIFNLPLLLEAVTIAQEPRCPSFEPVFTGPEAMFADSDVQKSYNDALAKSVTALTDERVVLIDMTGPFQTHGLCGTSPWWTGLDETPIFASLHPNAFGTQAYVDQFFANLPDLLK